MKSNTQPIPADGWAGLKAHGTTDALSGFLVFLLALPLSMGIAQASDFEPIYGLITAMVGGLVVALLAGSPLTIKGPAAGLIVIVAGAVADFGGGQQGWTYTLGAVVVAGVIQVLFGLLKFGKLSDFFPISAVHGMLAAIGLIIISKQVHGLMGINPMGADGKPIVAPLTLIGEIPHSMAHVNTAALIVGLVSLLIVFGWPMLNLGWAKKIPAPLVVLLVSIPLSMQLDLAAVVDDKGAPKLLVHFSKGLTDILGVKVSFAGIAQMGVFVKYVVMFALVGSLEALLTVKAIDLVDPYQRKSDYNKDLMAVGIGNVVSGILGGLPMISEVARSSANVNNGAKTRWANFFHGFFILLFLLFAVRFSDLIPKPALSALLIGVGYKLAHPKEFIHVFHIGKEQLAIFVVTIFFTLFEDLLVGIGAGIVLKMMIQLVNGTPLHAFFKTPVSIEVKDNRYLVTIAHAAVFSNYLGIKKYLQRIPQGAEVTIDLQHTRLVDHSVMENLHLFEMEYQQAGGRVLIVGLDGHAPLAGHPHSGRKKKK